MSGRKADNKDKMQKDEKKGKKGKKGKGSKGSKGSKSSRSKAKKPKQTTITLQRSPDDLGHPGSYVKALHIVRRFFLDYIFCYLLTSLSARVYYIHRVDRII